MNAQNTKKENNSQQWRCSNTEKTGEIDTST